MNIACILSENFYHMKNTMGNSCSFKLNWFQAGGPFGHVAISRNGFRSITTKSARRRQEKLGKKLSTIDLKLVNGKEIPSTTLNSESLEFRGSRMQSLTPGKRVVDSKIVEWPATVLVFDIETTGFSRENDRIIEIAFRDLLGGRNSTFQTLVNPEKAVTNTYVHKISTRMVSGPGVPRMKDLIPIIIKYVESRQMSGKPVVLVAHNGRQFDIPFFVKEFRRCSTEVPKDWLFVDTLPIARKLVKEDGSKLPKVSLEELRKYYQIPLVGHCHRAMHDVIVLSMVLQKMSFELKLSVADLVSSSFRASDVTKGNSREEDSAV